MTCSTSEGSEQRLVGSITTDGLFDRGDIVFAARDFASDAGWIFQDTGLTATSRLPGMIGNESQSVDAGYPVPLNQTVFAQSQFKARPHNLNPEYERADMSLYQAPNNNALVVSLGSPDWSLGLDIYTSDFPSTIYLRDHPAIPQMTRNILEGVGGLSHVPHSIGPGYTVSISTTQDPNIFTVSWSAPAGRLDQGCTDPTKPWCDFVVLHDVTQSDDVGVLVDYFKRYPAGSPTGSYPINVSTLPAGTYAAEYVTVDRVWISDYGDPLRTIWRAAKSSTTITR